MKDSWQCHICGTVYAFWVSRCKEKHLVITPRSLHAAQKLRDELDKEIGKE